MILLTWYPIKRKYCGKNNLPEKICFKLRHKLAKANKKSPNEQSIALYFYSIQLSKYYSSMKWVMDFGSSNHMNGSFSLFTSVTVIGIHHKKFQLVMINIFQ